MQVITTEDILINGEVNPPYRIKIDTKLEVYDGEGKENGHKGWIWVRLPDCTEGEGENKRVIWGYYTQLSPFQYAKVQPAANSYSEEAA